MRLPPVLNWIKYLSLSYYTGQALLANQFPDPATTIDVNIGLLQSLEGIPLWLAEVLLIVYGMTFLIGAVLAFKLGDESSARL